MVPFNDFIRQHVGTSRWVVAARLTPALSAKGYAAAISYSRHKDLHREWIEASLDAATRGALARAMVMLAGVSVFDPEVIAIRDDFILRLRTHAERELRHLQAVA